MSETIRVLVAHPEQQHSYRLASALQQAGMLDSYATTVYNKQGSLTALVAKVLPPRLREKATGRHNPGVPDEKVIQLKELDGLIQLFCMHVPAAKPLYYRSKQRAADTFSKAAARFAVKHGVDAVMAYDSTSPVLFETLRDTAPNIVRILDMSAASTLFMRTIYERDFELKPGFAEQLRKERDIVWNPARIERAKREFQSTDYFLCGSQFVVRSLEESGVSRDACLVCHYGVDTSLFTPSEKPAPRTDEPLECVFVGGTKELKGIAYLLDAFASIDPSKARLTIVGGNTLSPEHADRYARTVRFAGKIPHAEVARLLQEAHVMVFPSLGEGFSLSCLEALAAGLPVIVTTNTGTNDVVVEGENGFVIPIQDENAIKEKVMWFVENRDQLPRMSRAARLTAEQHTWDHYSNDVVSAVTSFVQRKRG